MPDTPNKGDVCTRCVGTGRQTVSAYDRHTGEHRTETAICQGCWGRGNVKTHQRNAQIVAFRKP